MQKDKFKYQHIIGNKYGKLLVVSTFSEKYIQKSGKSHYRTRAKCKCDCGKTHECDTKSLVSKKTTSCGCRRDQYLKNTGKNCKLFTGYEGIGGAFISVIKRRANKRGYKMDLTAKFLWELFKKQNKKCALSNIDLTITNKNNTTTASLDRIDSSKGYTKGNVQWVHKKINIMKNTLDQNEFINFCRLVAKNVKN